MRDIIQGVENANVVLADATDRNPNVDYEIGIAHARRRPVILITQDRGDIPFDLRQYRTIQYSTSFDQVVEVPQKLVDVVSAVLDDPRIAGGPYSDFAVAIADSSGTQTESDLETNSPKGIFDLQVDLQDAFETATPIVESFGETMQEFGARAVRLTEDINREKRLGGEVDARRVRSLLREAAKGFAHDTENLRAQRIKYEMAMRPVEDDLELLLREILNAPDADLEQIEEAGSLLRSARDSAEQGRASCITLADTISNLLSMERDINRSLRSARDEVMSLGGAFESTVRFFDRGFAVIDRAKEDRRPAGVGLT